MAKKPVRGDPQMLSLKRSQRKASGKRLAIRPQTIAQNDYAKLVKFLV
jgi:hypothetical protein